MDLQNLELAKHTYLMKDQAENQPQIFQRIIKQIVQYWTEFYNIIYCRKSTASRFI